MTQKGLTMNRTEPPNAHANHLWDEEAGLLKYEYNGRTLITIRIPEGADPYYRRISDGNLQSNPFIQQLYLALERPETVRVRFELSGEAINMRPRRAEVGEAILGQVGRPVIYGVSGLYDILQDLFIDWSGAPWSWACTTIGQAQDGSSWAEIDVEVGSSPWIINLRMQYYRAHLNFRYHKPWEWRPNLKPMAGWCSWEAYRSDVQEEDVFHAAHFVSEHFKAYGLEYIQIDDGYQQQMVPPRADGRVADAWLETNGKFPSGHEGLITAIRNEGLEPGIWTNAVVTNPLFAAESSSCITDEDGVPLKGKWIQYVLDCSPNTLARHVAPYYKGLKDFGHTYFKTDAIRHLIYDGLHEAVKLGLITNDEAETRFRSFLECAREQIGDDAYLLSCWGVLSEAVGLADACRIATDSNPSWPAIKMQLVESARWFHTQRILFLNDPDHVCVRAPLEWARSAISLVSLTGGLLMISDKPESYDEERINMIRRNLPPLTTVTAETGAFELNLPAFAWTHVKGYSVDLHRAGEQKTQADMNDIGEDGTEEHPFAALWAIHILMENKSWCVVGRFAVDYLEASSISCSQIGLDPGNEYAVFDFWEQQYLGTYRNEVPVRSLVVGHCQLLAIKAVQEHPMLLASSRHVSMDAVSVRSEHWESEKLSMTVVLKGITQTVENYWFYVPHNFAIEDFKCLGATGELAIGPQPELVKLSLHFNDEDTEVRLKFSRAEIDDQQ
ncbi:hypothetical protein [Paenibacillus sp. GCM10028914]|uniref:hypothetical protein n=1 Tax=Paenibacillus sp. GCM10028914 TaxID=3273416 RepID=UPI00361E8205